MSFTRTVCKESKKIFHIKEIDKSNFEICCVDVNGIEFIGKFSSLNNELKHSSRFKWLDQNSYNDLMKTINNFLKNKEKKNGKA